MACEAGRMECIHEEGLTACQWAEAFQADLIWIVKVLLGRIRAGQEAPRLRKGHHPMAWEHHLVSSDLRPIGILLLTIQMLFLFILYRFAQDCWTGAVTPRRLNRHLIAIIMDHTRLLLVRWQTVMRLISGRFLQIHSRSQSPMLSSSACVLRLTTLQVT